MAVRFPDAFTAGVADKLVRFPDAQVSILRVGTELWYYPTFGLQWGILTHFHPLFMRMRQGSGFIICDNPV